MEKVNVEGILDIILISLLTIFISTVFEQFVICEIKTI